LLTKLWNTHLLKYVIGLSSVPTKILVCQRVPKKSAALACLTMSKIKINQRVPNKSANLLKKISLMGTEGLSSAHHV